jgi:hypothetical protein
VTLTLPRSENFGEETDKRRGGKANTARKRQRTNESPVKEQVVDKVAKSNEEPRYKHYTRGEQQWASFAAVGRNIELGLLVAKRSVRPRRHDPSKDLQM